MLILHATKAMELPWQVRPQMEFGNEGKLINSRFVILSEVEGSVRPSDRGRTELILRLRSG
jgi:hypothetical protein